MSAECTAVSSLSVVEASAFTRKQSRREFDELEAWLMSKEAMQLPLDEVEREQDRRGREVQRLLLQAHIQQRGLGDVGPAIEVIEGDDGIMRLPHRREHERHEHTIFGEVVVNRFGYGRPGATSVHPLDEDLSLPQDSYSYELQRRVVKAAVQGPFDEAVERVEESTGVRIPKRSTEEMAKDAAADFDAFYKQRVLPQRAAKTGPIVVGAVDCKGVPMVKPAPAERVVRRGKGKKANKKRMATVATVFTTEPRVRSPEEVVESLFFPELSEEQKKEKRRRPRPENKRVWASLKDSKDAVIDEVAEEMRRRDPKDRKTHVVVTDGERALQIRVRKRVRSSTLLILDLLHVLEKLWKAAYVFHPEGSEEAQDWVYLRAYKILCGEVSQVVKGLRQMVTKRRLRGEKRKTLLAVASYFYRNRKRMCYDEYLAQGLPIASGAVEGACKNLVKDRMERSGMRWKEESAEAMLKLRATYLSGDFEEYWRFHVKLEQERIHPDGAWRPVLSVVEE